jgi:hypothetical protein
MEYVPQVSEKVYFGREHGERSLGKVVKVNRSAAKIEQLETRGAHPKGTVWTVPFTLISSFESGPRPASTPPPPFLRPDQAALIADELAALRADNDRLRAEVVRLKSKTAHVRVASTPAMPAVRPRARAAARANAN